MVDEFVYIDNKKVDQILEIAVKNEVEFICYEGVLQDNYILCHAYDIHINGKGYKYIVIKEVATNEWSSGSMLMVTNSDNIIEEFEMSFELY